jgi:hypothetical protein
MKIYKNQTKLRITLETDLTSLSGCTVKIKYRKPSQATGQWTAAASGSTIYYDIASTSDLDQTGVWTLWSHVTWGDGTVAEGEPVLMNVYESGT